MASATPFLFATTQKREHNTGLPKHDAPNTADTNSAEQYYGKFHGVVLNNLDPEQRGRLLAQVPSVAVLLPTTWAMPCTS